MEDNKKYCVCDCNGNLAGHDLSPAEAKHVLEIMQEREPDAEWEIIEQE